MFQIAFKVGIRSTRNPDAPRRQQRARCESVAGLACGAEFAECVDTASGAVVDGGAHCPNHGGCELQCRAPSAAPTAAGNHSGSGDGVDDADSAAGGGAGDDRFCWGSGVDMHMDGFHSMILDEARVVCCDDDARARRRTSADDRAESATATRACAPPPPR